MKIRAERELEGGKGPFVLITAIHRDPNIPDMRDEWGLKDRLHISITIFTLLLADVVKQIENNWALAD